MYMLILCTALCGIAFGAQSKYSQFQLMAVDHLSNSNGSLAICHADKTQQKWKMNPYVVAIRRSADSFGSWCCTGSIISLDPAVIVTSAVCITGCGGPDGLDAVIRIGCDDPSNCNGYSYTVSQAIQHPDWGDPLQYSNNIGLFILTNPIIQKKAETVVIPSFAPSEGDVFIVGYGIVENGQYPTKVQAANTDLLDIATCDAIWTSLLGGGPWFDETMTCFQDLKTTDDPVVACGGDFGAPFGERRGNQEMNQYGLVSVSISGPCSGCSSCCGIFQGNVLPQMGTNVPFFRDWINSHIQVSRKNDFNDTGYNL